MCFSSKPYEFCTGGLLCLTTRFFWINPGNRFNIQLPGRALPWKPTLTDLSISLQFAVEEIFPTWQDFILLKNVLLEIQASEPGHVCKDICCVLIFETKSTATRSTITSKGQKFLWRSDQQWWWCPSRDSTNNNGTSGPQTIYNRYKIEHCIHATFNTEKFDSSNF